MRVTRRASRPSVRRRARQPRRPARPRACLAALAWLLLAPATAAALVHFDFEQKYFVHPGQQVWDFCLVRDAGLYHIFYIQYPEDSPGAHCTALGHATSPDLARWDILPPAVPAGPDWWDADNVWAPDVVWDSGRRQWAMLFTGVDSLKVQRACAAWSNDLSTWTKEPANPVFQPDSLAYYWAPSQQWSPCRDPFLFLMDGMWNMLSTAALRLGGYPGTKRGIVHRAVSADLVQWQDAGPFYINDGVSAWHDLESSQYLARDGWHHLFFTEQDVPGVSHIASDSLGGWRMADRRVIDGGYAAEVDQFDPGIDIFSRYAVGQHRDGSLFRVVRFDTLLWNDGGRTPVIHRPHPLDGDWAYRAGAATLGNPIFGDNPVERGEPTSGLVGNGWFSSQEYYQGPLSGRGSPGTCLGDAAVGQLDSRPFFVTGDFISLLVGGGYYPQTCFVALMDADADTVLELETGQGAETMTERIWNVRPYQGRLVYVRILDAEQGPGGHISVDEIREISDPLSDAGPATGERVPPLMLLGARPNPANPATRVEFSLGRPGVVQLAVHDAAGRLVWRSPPQLMLAGQQGVTWRGTDALGRAAPAGTYLYRLALDGREQATGKICLVK